MRKKSSIYTKKLAPKIPFQPMHNLYEYGKGDCVCNFNPLNTSELAKICRKVIAQGVFALTMPELKCIHNAIYIAALEKDPLKKITTMLSLDLNDSQYRIECLESQLAESTKQLKRLLKPRAQDINITINTPITCNQNQTNSNVFKLKQ